MDSSTISVIDAINSYDFYFSIWQYDGDEVSEF